VHLVLLPHGSGSVPRHVLDMYHQATSCFMQQLGIGRSLKGDLGMKIPDFTATSKNGPEMKELNLPSM